MRYPDPYSLGWPDLSQRHERDARKMDHDNTMVPSEVIPGLLLPHTPWLYMREMLPCNYNPIHRASQLVWC
jgi:hypothetical protein